MHCPFCESEDTKVIDSRLSEDGYAVRRRRKCLRCEERFTTYEKAETLMPRIVKQDGRREIFNEEKLRTGILRALEKRPVQMSDVDAAIARIMHKVRACGEREVKSLMIGDLTMNELRDLDRVAYVRYASVYRAFEDMQAFRDEIEKLEKIPSPELNRLQVKLLDDEAPE